MFKSAVSISLSSIALNKNHNVFLLPLLSIGLMLFVNVSSLLKMFHDQLNVDESVCMHVGLA